MMNQHIPDLMCALEQELPHLIALRHQLHKRPELSHQEYETTALIKQELQRYGVEILDYGLQTGVVGYIKGTYPGKCLALREDIDALPIAERTGLPFSSEQEGVSHACGHDIHIAVLLGCAKVLMAHRATLHGSVLLIFQCAEEQCDGAVTMMQKGIMASPRPDALVGLHCSPVLKLGTFGVIAGISNASCDTITIDIIGRGGHGAHPYQCVDPIAMTAYLLTQLQTIISRENKPTQPAVLTFGQIQGGTAPNIIPDQVQIRGTLRTFDQGVRQKHLESIKRLSAYCCQAMGGSCLVTVEKGMPPLVNTPVIARQFCEAVRGAFGEEAIIQGLAPSMGSDDFSCLLEACNGQGGQFLLGTQIPENPNTGLGLHVAENCFPDEAILPGAKVLSEFAWTYLTERQS